MTRHRPGVCLVCRLPATQKEPLWTAAMRDRSTGRARPVTVHPGACAQALFDRFEPITSVEDEMPKVSDKETTVTEVEAEVAAAAIRNVAAAQPGPVPAVVADEGQADDQVVDAEVVDDQDQVTEHLPMITTQDVVEWIRVKKPLPVFDPEDIARGIAWEIISAPSLEKALEVATVRQAKEFYYQHLTVRGVKWQMSADKFDGLPFYCVLDCVDPSTGEPMLVTCGGMNVAASMVKADLAGEWPITIQLTEQETSRGNTTLKVQLVRTDQPAFADADGVTF